MKKVTIKNKLYLLVSIATIILICMDICSLIIFTKLKTDSYALEFNYCPSNILTNDLNHLIDDYRDYQYKHILTNDRNSKYMYESKLNELTDDINQVLSQCEDLIIKDKCQKLYTNAKNDWEKYVVANNSLLTLSNTPNFTEAINYYNIDSKVLYDNLKQSIDYMLNTYNSYIQTEINKSQAQYENLIFFNIIILFIIPVITVMSINYISKSIKKPVDELLFVTNQIAKGNLNIEINYDSNDEISDLLYSTKTLIKKLKNIVSDEKHILEELTIGNYNVNSFCIEEYTGDFKPIIDSLYTLSNHLEESTKNEYQAIILQELSQNVDVVFLIYDLSNHQVEYVFENAERILGIHPVILKENIFTLFNQCSSSILESAKEIFIEEKLDNRFSQEVDFTNPKGNQNMFLSIVIKPVTMSDTVTKYIMAVEDLTEYKKNHKALKDALLNAQNANAAKSKFFSSISHDIRTPLNAIIGMTSIALSNVDNTDRNKIKDCLNKITYSSKHLLMLINDVLDSAKIESGKLTLNNDTFDLRKIIEEVVAITSSQIKAKNQELSVIFKNINYNLLIGDVLRLMQVLLNILSNAINYTPHNGKITIKVKQFIKHTNNSIKVQFSIIDNGYGMSSDFIEKIFIPYEREHNYPVKNNSGSGLGMPIAKNLVTLMNGSIRVKSAKSQGSTFIVTLPFVVACAEKKVYKEKCFKELNILVIDSDENARNHTKYILEQNQANAKYTKSGIEGTQLVNKAIAEKIPFDIIMIDLQPTDITSILAIEMIYNMSSNKPLIIATYSQQEEPLNKALKAGANILLLKPFTQIDLYNTILTSNSNIQENTTTTPDNLNGYRILIVEDNELNMEIAVELLKKTGATLDCAYDGKEAFSLYESTPEGYYNLIIMDVQMPDVDGYTATKMIRNSKHKDAKTIPIIAMTSYAYIEDINAALNAGMNAHIAKPIDVTALYKIIRKELHLK